MTAADILAFARANPSLPPAPLAWALALDGATPDGLRAAAAQGGTAWDPLLGTLAARLERAAMQMPTDSQLLAQVRVRRVSATAPVLGAPALRLAP